MLDGVNGPIAVVGIPTALGGQLPDDRHVGMAAVPSDLRRLGLLERLGAAGLDLRDDGDLAIEPGVREDPDPRAEEPGRDRRIPATGGGDGGCGPSPTTSASS